MAKQHLLVERISARLGGGKSGMGRAESILALFERLMDVGYDSLVRRRYQAESGPEDREGVSGVRKKPRT